MTGVGFMCEKPDYEQMAKRIYENPELILEKYGESALDQSKYYEYIIKKGIDEKEVRCDINVEFIAGLINNIISDTLTKMIRVGDKDYLSNAEKYCDQLIDFIKFGIGSK